VLFLLTYLLDDELECSWRSNILKFGEQFVLEYAVRFEFSLPKGGFS
jgi:hypothetical protein